LGSRAFQAERPRSGPARPLGSRPAQADPFESLSGELVDQGRKIILHDAYTLRDTLGRLARGQTQKSLSLLPTCRPHFAANELLQILPIDLAQRDRHYAVP